jgi:DEAD/DEAH box helicase domain-containing protein
MDYVIFDIETQTWFDQLPPSATYGDLKISVLGAYFSRSDKYIAFFEHDLEDFVQQLKTVDLVVGYNSISFDYKVLQPYTNLDTSSLPSYDIMLEIEKKIGYKVKLDDVASATLGYAKTDKGSNAPKYFKEGKWDKLVNYCMHDVKITHQVFQEIMKNGQVQYQDLIEKRLVSLDKPTKKHKALRYFEQSIF